MSDKPKTTPAVAAAPAKDAGLKSDSYADGYQPTGKVRVIAQSDSARVLEDDVRRWREPR
ncbi:MAG: hypothetical protein IT512_07395 [Rhodocyclaceae bacterium]|nr:hypothetical protein [Rhodocyclaceae bacterium]